MRSLVAARNTKEKINLRIVSSVAACSTTAVMNIKNYLEHVLGTAGNGLVQRRQAETPHLFENDISLSATGVCLIGIMAIDNATAVKQ